MTITMPSIPGSYVFWSIWWQPKPTDTEKEKKVKTLNFRTAKREELLGLNQGECPFCHGAELKLFPKLVPYGLYESDAVLCACMILQQTETDWEIESYWQPRKLSDLKLLPKPNKEAAENTKFIRDTSVQFIKQLGMWVYLYGGLGSAKTHILEAIKTQLRGLALYINAADLASALRTAVGRNEVSEIVDLVSGAPVLLLDDLGVELKSDFLYSALYTIINRRYAKRFLAPTFITSNLTQEEIAMSEVENMRRIASRVSDNKLVIPLVSTQVDYRGVE